MKKKIYITITIIAVIALISGVTLLASAAPGDKSDPLITLSYLNGPFRTLISKDIDAAIKELSTRVTNTESNLKTEMDAARTATGNVFKLVKLSANSSQTFAAGSELMLQSGTSSFSVKSGDLICLTGTPSSAGSGSMTVNYMYLSTGSVTVTAGSDGAKIWVRSAG